MLKNKKKLLIIAQSAMSIRNWSTTGVFEKLSINFQVSIVTPHAGAISNVKNMEIFEVKEFESVLGSLFRKIYYVKYQQNFYKRMPQDSYYLRKKRCRKTIKLKIYYLIERFSVFFSISLLKKIWEYFNYSKNTEDLIKLINPDVVLSTHAYCPYDWHFVFNAKILGKKITTHIHSWDNITTRPGLLFDYDKVFVWGEWMYDSVLNYNDIPINNISIVGAPYIDFIKQGVWIKSRASSLPESLRLNQKYVLIVGSSKSLFPNFIKSLPFIAKTLKSFNSILVFRPYHDSFNDVDSIDTRDIIISKPGDAFSGSYTKERINATSLDIDTELTAYLNLMKYADIVITQASSSGIEAALIGTPVITYADVSVNDLIEKSNLREFFFSEHNRRMSTCQDITYIENKNDLECIIAKIYKNNASYRNIKDSGFNRILDEDFNFNFKLSEEIEFI
jgi:UDP-N-acetylglucosamine:LPS N-acetylglucosamine transferase